MRPIAECLVAQAIKTEGLAVYFGEVYGAGLPAAKHYTTARRTSFRLFDAVVYQEAQLRETESWTPERLSGWREAGGQPFLREEELRLLAEVRGLDLAPLVYEGDAAEIGSSIEAARGFLSRCGEITRCHLDGGEGKLEGIVVRTPDRKQIAKLRHEDYERLRKRRP